MGYHMARHVRRKMSPSATLFICDVNKEACVRLVDELGSQHGPIKIVDTAKEAADDSNVVISIVPRAGNVRQVYLGAGGVVEAQKGAQRLLLECSTIDAKTTREVEAELSKAGVGRYFDSGICKF